MPDLPNTFAELCDLEMARRGYAREDHVVPHNVDASCLKYAKGTEVVYVTVSGRDLRLNSDAAGMLKLMRYRVERAIEIARDA